MTLVFCGGIVILYSVDPFMGYGRCQCNITSNNTSERLMVLLLLCGKPEVVKLLMQVARLL